MIKWSIFDVNLLTELFNWDANKWVDLNNLVYVAEKYKQMGYTHMLLDRKTWPEILVGVEREETKDEEALRLRWEKEERDETILAIIKIMEKFNIDLEELR